MGSLKVNDDLSLPIALSSNDREPNSAAGSVAGSFSLQLRSDP